MFRMLNKRGQNTAEYAILIGVVVAAAIAMQVYVRRGLQARTKDAVDHSLGMESEGVFNTTQYEPYYMDTDYLREQDTRQTEGMIHGGELTRVLEYENVSQTGTSIVGNWSAGN